MVNFTKSELVPFKKWSWFPSKSGHLSQKVTNGLPRMLEPPTWRMCRLADLRYPVRLRPESPGLWFCWVRGIQYCAKCEKWGMRRRDLRICFGGFVSFL
jgi:hypothetical protein